MDFTILADHRVKIKENKNKYLEDSARELKSSYEGDGDTTCKWCTWNNTQRGLEELEIWGWAYTIQTTALLRSARIPKRVPKT